MDRYFPDEGPFRRELYPKHCEFFRNGTVARERCFMAGNHYTAPRGAFSFRPSSSGSRPGNIQNCLHRLERDTWTWSRRHFFCGRQLVR
jgi:hypothetical protein